jgi:broad specificity phosphatase PhoE
MERPMIVFALRHADRTPAGDLSPAGIERAKLLARMLAESGIRTAYCSDAIRTQRTMDPLKALLGSDLEILVVPTDGAGGIEEHVQEIVAKVKALPGDAVAAVVGHSNTVGPIIEGLTGRAIAPIKENEFDKLFVLSIPGTGAGTATVAPTRYGKAS